MADATKVVRFPIRKKLHLVWSSSLTEDGADGVRETSIADDGGTEPVSGLPELSAVVRAKSDPDGL